MYVLTLYHYAVCIRTNKSVVEQEMLSYASCLYGQSLAQNCQGKNAIRRAAMKQFISSAM